MPSRCHRRFWYRNTITSCFVYPLGRPRIAAGSDHHIHTCPFVRPPSLFKIAKEFSVRIVIATGRGDHWWHLSLLISFRPNLVKWTRPANQCSPELKSTSPKTALYSMSHFETEAISKSWLITKMSCLRYHKILYDMTIKLIHLADPQPDVITMFNYA